MSAFDIDLRSVVGRVSAAQSFGTVDGPGIRFVVFMQGCPLRCACCHNPETWDTSGGEEMTAGALFDRILRYKSYFGDTGGVTVSGGEPLVQADFVRALFTLCRASGIHTCLDTSGCIVNDSSVALLSVTDLVLLDMKYASDEKYRQYVGCSLELPLSFLKKLDEVGISTWIRQVIVRGINDSDADIGGLVSIIRGFACIQKIELLPFRRLCKEKYETMGEFFRFGHISDTTEAEIAILQKNINDLLS